MAKPGIDWNFTSLLKADIPIAIWNFRNETGEPGRVAFVKRGFDLYFVETIIFYPGVKPQIDEVPPFDDIDEEIEKAQQLIERIFKPQWIAEYRNPEVYTLEEFIETPEMKVNYWKPGKKESQKNA